MAPGGAHVVALAAKQHSVPFVVLAGLHKLSPLFPHDPSVTFNDFKVSPFFPAFTNLQCRLIVTRPGQSVASPYSYDCDSLCMLMVDYWTCIFYQQ